MRLTRRTVPLLAGVFAVAMIFGALGPSTSRADDRDLFTSSGTLPYVMTILDTSSSMHNQPSGAAARGSGEDPNGRLYLAKAALYEVVKEMEPGIRLGWAHFNQESLRVTNKHWIYQRDPAAPNPPWYGSVPFPAPGQAVEFGQPVVDGDNFSYFDCSGPDTGAGDAERLLRLGYFPKLGPAGTTATFLYTQIGGQAYEVRFAALAPNVLGQVTADAGINVDVRVRRVNPGGACTTKDGFQHTATLRFVPFYTQDNDGIPFVTDGNNDGTPEQLPFDFVQFHGGGALAGLGTIQDYTRKDACDSGDDGGRWWDPNDNGATGTGMPSDVSYTTRPDPVAPARDPTNHAFDRGDVIALDWLTHPVGPPTLGFEFSSQQELLYRLAPNTAVAGEFHRDANGDPIPDFRIGRYFQPVPSSGKLSIKPQFARFPPIMAGSGTPLAGVLEDFLEYFERWEPVASGPNGDPNYDCRQKFVILLTDGAESCGGNPGAAAAALFAAGVRVFVIGFGADLTAAQLDPIADNGGTGSDDKDGNGVDDCEQFGGDPGCEGPLLAANKTELVEALKFVSEGIAGGSASFTSAAVPTSQSEAQNSLFVTSFRPMGLQEPLWAGSLNHFIRPLPLAADTLDQDADGDTAELLPDKSATCPTEDPVGCFAWDARDVLLTQAPTKDEAAGGDFRLSDDSLDRRLYYAQEIGSNSVGLDKRLFLPVSASDDALVRADLWTGLGIPFVLGNAASEAAAMAETRQIVERTVQQKTVLDPALETDVTFVLGDIFHSDPVVIEAPNRFQYMIANLPAGSSAACRVNQTTSNPLGDFDFTKKGYRCFFERHRFRRKVVAAGANDTQLHALDAGRFSFSIDSDGNLDGEFNTGSGSELFAWIPRELMPRAREMAVTSAGHEFSFDGTLVIDDVFIDPQHAGAPLPADREWRTVAVGGLREGGRAYHAVDLTQPDYLVQATDRLNTVVPDDAGSLVPRCTRQFDSDPAKCGPTPYPTVLWEFTDALPDLGFTWSQPNTGRVLVCTEDATPCPQASVAERYVAVFGGGFDPQNPAVGNVLYIIDIETGKAILKRPLLGAVPSEPAAVDANNDGTIDTIYIGTTRGIMYKIDVSEPAPLFDEALVPGPDPNIKSTFWNPVAIFDTGGRPIFYPPSVIFVATEGRFALAWATGDRDDFRTIDPQESRLYILLDTGFDETTVFSTVNGFTEADLDGVPANNPLLTLNDPLLNPTAGRIPGFFLILAPNERAITKAITLIGITVFSTFTPDAEVENGECGTTGVSRVYTIFTLNGNPVGNTNPRFREIEGFVSNPYTEPGAVIGGEEQPPQPGDSDNDGIPDDLEGVYDTLKSQFPPNCRFSNVNINIKAIRSDTGVEFIAPVPVCIIAKNWKEF